MDWWQIILSQHILYYKELSLGYYSRVKIARRAPTTLFYYILQSMVNYGYQKGPSICVFFCLSLSLCLPVLSQHFFTCYLLLLIINSIGLLRSLNYGWSKINKQTHYLHLVL